MVRHRHVPMRGLRGWMGGLVLRTRPQGHAAIPARLACFLPLGLDDRLPFNDAATSLEELLALRLWWRAREVPSVICEPAGSLAGGRWYAIPAS